MAHAKAMPAAAAPKRPPTKSVQSASVFSVTHVLGFGFRVAQGLRNHKAVGAAPAMAFHFFLSLIPVLVLVGFILGQLVRKNGVEALLGPVLDAAPDVAETVVRSELERLAGSHVAPLAPLSVIGFLWLASSGTHGLMDVFELSVQAKPRVWWKKRVIAMLWVISALIAVAVMGWSLLKVDRLIHHTDARAEVAPSRKAVLATGAGGDRTAAKPRARPPVVHAPWERALALAVISLVGVGGLAGFYRFSVEHPSRVRRRAWPGAFAAFGAWLIVSWGFGEYVSSLGKYTFFYGSVAAVAVLLVWFYLTSWSLLIGAEVNAQLEGIRDRHRSSA